MKMKRAPQDVVLVGPSFSHPIHTAIGNGPGGDWSVHHEFPIPEVALGSSCPTIYGWYAVRQQETELLYVGQTIRLFERTRTHTQTRDRHTVGRVAWDRQRRGWRVFLAWRQFQCDCSLDPVEREYIARLKPLLNVSAGNEVGERDTEYPHDELCPLADVVVLF